MIAFTVYISFISLHNPLRIAVKKSPANYSGNQLRKIHCIHRIRKIHWNSDEDYRCKSKYNYSLNPLKKYTGIRCITRTYKLAMHHKNNHNSSAINNSVNYTKFLHYKISYQLHCKFTDKYTVNPKSNSTIKIKVNYTVIPLAYTVQIHGNYTVNQLSNYTVHHSQIHSNSTNKYSATPLTKIHCN